MIDDELLQPTVRNDAPPRGRGSRPWRLQPQFWVAFLGGALACGTIAILNAGRLGIPRKQRWMMGGLTALTVGVLLALWMRQPPAPTFVKFTAAARDMRLYARIAAVVLYLGLAAMQRKADAHYQVFSEGEYDSLWLPGIGAILVAGTVQTLLTSVMAWFAR